MTTCTLAEYARRVGKSRAAVSQWKKAKRVVMVGDLVDVEATDAWLKRWRREGLPDLAQDSASVKRGRPSVKQVAQLNSLASLTVADVKVHLASLDWTQTFDWSDEAVDQRARDAARCVGWEAVTSERDDDGHWGGYQLRIPEYIERRGGLHYGAIAGGFGYELDAFDVLELIREHVEETDAESIDVDPDSLHLLAYPFGEQQTQPE